MYISEPRAPAMPPRSMTDVSGQPKLVKIWLAVALASASSPATKIVCSPGMRSGCTMTSQNTVLSVLTTLAPGNSRWICSPRLSVLATVSIGGMPWLMSSGRATSMSTLPARFSAPTPCSALMLFAPLLAFITSSANAPASASCSNRTSGCSAAHCA